MYSFQINRQRRDGQEIVFAFFIANDRAQFHRLRRFATLNAITIFQLTFSSHGLQSKRSRKHHTFYVCNFLRGIFAA
jgi:hypothetical protein